MVMKYVIEDLIDKVIKGQRCNKIYLNLTIINDVESIIVNVKATHGSFNMNQILTP